MADETATLTIALRDAISQSLRTVAKNLDDVNTKAKGLGEAGSRGMDVMRRDTDRTAESVGRLSNQMSNLSRFTMGLVRGIIGAGLGAGLLELGRSFREFAEGATQMRYLGQETRLTAQQLMQFQQAGNRMGMTAQEVNNALTSISGRLVDLSRGAASATFQALAHMPGGAVFAAQLRRQVESGNMEGAILSVFDRMRNAVGGDRAARQLAEAFGIPLRMAETREVLQRNIPVIMRNAEAAEHFHNAVVDLDWRLQGLRYTIGNRVITVLGDLGKWFEEHQGEVDRWAREFETALRQVDWHGIAADIRLLGDAALFVSGGLKQALDIIRALKQAQQPGGSRRTIVESAVGPSRVGELPHGLEHTTRSDMRKRLGLDYLGRPSREDVDEANRILARRDPVRGIDEMVGRPELAPELPIELRSPRVMRHTQEQRAHQQAEDEQARAAPPPPQPPSMLDTIRRGLSISPIAFNPDDTPIGRAFRSQQPAMGMRELGLQDLLRVELDSNRILSDIRDLLGGAGGAAPSAPGSGQVAGAGPTFRRGVGPGAQAGGYGEAGGGARAGGAGPTFRRGVGPGAGADLQGPTGPATGALRDRIGEFKAAAMDQLRKEGVPEKHVEEAANLLAGQAMRESGINPRASHDQGTGYGIYGARLGRRSAMLSWMRQHNYAPDSLEGQTRYMAHEAITGRGYGPTRQALMSADPARRRELTNTITRNFEAPRVTNERASAVEQAAGVTPRSSPHDSPGAAGPGLPGPQSNLLRQYKESQVAELQGEVAAKRRLPITDTLRSQLNYAAAQTGLKVEVTSGGQAPYGHMRTGSHRHDFGQAADLRLRDPKTGQLLDMSNPVDAARMAQFTQAAVSAGATGVGAGMGYMGPREIHIGGGRPAFWGGAPWIPEAWRRGRDSPVDLRHMEPARDEPQPNRASVDRGMAGGLGMGGVGGIMGTARLDVNVRAPRNTKVDADADGVFQKVKLTRTPQMGKSGGDSAEWSNWSYE
jgi:Phage tail lysozyme